MTTQRSSDKKTVLIIDDERDILTLLKKRLEANDFKCVAAADAIEGLETARRVKPDLILLDLMLPHMSGFGFMREIKKRPDLAGTPVVALTAISDEEVARETMDLGVVGYLTKSCDPQVLIRMVREHAISQKAS